MIGRVHLTIVAAMSENLVIGSKGALPWKLPDDLKRFRKLTAGKPVIMGRKTYESIGRPLPDRMNIVISRQPKMAAPGCVVVSSPEKAIEAVVACGNQAASVIGGGEIYKVFLPITDTLELTLVHVHATGDAFFPSFSRGDFVEIANERHPADDKHEHPFLFRTLVRWRP